MKNFYTVLKQANYFYFSLILFVISLPLSEFMVSLAAAIMLAVSLIECSLIKKIDCFRQHKILLFIPAIFIVYLLSALITQNGETVGYDLRKALFFIAIPLSFITGKQISDKQKQNILIAFILAVFAAIVYALINWKIFHSEDDFNIHNASLITHIRFSFQMILAIWLLIFLIIKNKENRKLAVLMGAGAVIITGFLFLQKSLTGIVSFAGSMVFVFIYMAVKMKGYFRFVSLSVILLMFTVPVIYVGRIAYPFFNQKEFTSEELSQKTAQGNAYSHDFENKLIENGNYVYLFVCDDEMRQAWNERSQLKYDSVDKNGYPVNSTLVRYLASKGLKKDGEAVKSLTDQEIVDVNNGLSNYLLKKNAWSLYPRIYVSVWEYYNYIKLGEVNNQSLAQRLEFAKAALIIIKEHFWIGVGTGNWKSAFFDTYKKMNSNLSEKYYASSHNQYLNYLVKFGIIGFVLILFFIVYPVIKTKRYKDPIFLIFLGYMFIANFADSNFDSHMGSSFFVFFYCFFLITGGNDYFRIIYKS
jgi:hypothetical protein